MTRNFKINLKSDNGDTTSINYTLLDNEAVDIWAGLFNGPSTDPSQTLCFSSGKVSTERLNGLIDKFNNESKIEESRLIPRFVTSSFSEDIALLNKIHSMFEDYGEQIHNKGWLFEHLKSVGIDWSIRFPCDNGHFQRVSTREAGAKTFCQKCEVEVDVPHVIGLPQISASLNGINENVHLLESAVADFYNPKSYTSAWLSLPHPNQGRVPLPDSVKNLFQLSSEFGDLFLGYATRGKNLCHIMKDNDVDLLRSGGSATPQQFISKGVLSLFSGDKKTKWSENKNSSEERRLKDFNDWFDKENLTELGYVRDSIDNCLGYIKIGKFETLDSQRDWTCEEITQHYAKYNSVVNVEII
tara:strand:- start:4311 stop:5378 length:1068 start_codon:yes stop_codon:yes gene_type:complete